MAEDSWDTDPTYESKLTEEERRRGGTAESLAELSSGAGGKSMSDIRQDALSQDGQVQQAAADARRAERAIPSPRRDRGFARGGGGATELPEGPSPPARAQPPPAPPARARPPEPPRRRGGEDAEPAESAPPPSPPPRGDARAPAGAAPAAVPRGDLKVKPPVAQPLACLQVSSVM